MATNEPGKRVQQTAAIRQAKGSIIALADDHILWPENYITNMLPCFGENDVGAACGPIDVTIPKSRQHPSIVTSWEVAATRVADNRNPGMRAMYGAAQWLWIMAGATVFFRAEILQDYRFLKAYNNDYWLGLYKLDVGDDTFMSRWVQSKGWRIAFQDLGVRTTVLRTAKQDSAFATQMFRWERSTIQSFLRVVVEVPQIWK
ncbi:nucleotide-diphospho-sugar transferase [Xylariomycetidae sp. FL2044]|nr:nucleotide-diphospho-sugar transferase [Xylariomycetidae sp. FL2044]